MARIHYKSRRVGSGTKYTASISFSCGFNASESVLDVDQNRAKTEATRLLSIRIDGHTAKCDKH